MRMRSHLFEREEDEMKEGREEGKREGEKRERKGKLLDCVKQRRCKRALLFFKRIRLRIQ